VPLAAQQCRSNRAIDSSAHRNCQFHPFTVGVGRASNPVVRSQAVRSPIIAGVVAIKDGIIHNVNGLGQSGRFPGTQWSSYDF